MKYPLSIRAIHWLSALIIIGLLVVGIYMTPFDTANPAQSEPLYFWHKSFGVLAFIFVIIRIMNRRRHTLEELPDGMVWYEKLAAKIAHKALYLLMILVPILGYVQSSAFEFSSGVHFFIIDLPEFIPDNKLIFDITNFIHRWAAYALIGVITAHIGGALKHRFFDNKENNIMKRML